MSTEAEAPKKERWAYMGRRLDEDHKALYTWALFREDGVYAVHGGKLYSKRIEANSSPMSAVPGAVFEVHTTKDGTSVTIGGDLAPKYVEMLDNRKLVAEWEMLDEATALRLRVTKKMKQEMSEEFLQKTLAPIRNALRSAPPATRVAIRFLVNEYLSRA